MDIVMLIGLYASMVTTFILVLTGSVEYRPNSVGVNDLFVQTRLTSKVGMTVKIDKSRLFDILQDYSSGLSYRKIAVRQGLSKDKVMDILRLINDSTAEEMRDVIMSEIPLQWRSSLILLRNIGEQAHQIATDDSTRKEVVLQALKLQMDCMREVNSLLTDSVKIYNALQKVKDRRKDIIVAEAQAEASDHTDIQTDRQIDEDDGQLTTTSMASHTSGTTDDPPRGVASESDNTLSDEYDESGGVVEGGGEDEDGQ
jgi:hypothetical protein